MEMLFFQVTIAIISLMIIQTNSQSVEPVCSTRTSDLSGTDDDDFIQISCSDDEVMTSCLSFGENDIEEGRRDGEMILLDSGGAVCQAFNGQEGKGVRAYARCCLWPNMECSYPFTLSSIADTDTYHVHSVTCPDEDVAVGCMAQSSFSCIRGASPGISAITINSISPDASLEINNNICRAYSCRSVTPTAACCRAPGLECHVRTSPRSSLAAVNCNPGWIMTGCNIHTSNDTSGVPMGSNIVNDVCSAYGTGEEGIWAVAVCCRTVVTTTASPHPTTSKITNATVHLPTTNSVPGSTASSVCESLETPTDAYTVGGSMSVYYRGDSVTFDCQDGFEQNAGDRQRMCEFNGQWSGTALECTKSGVYVPQYALFVAGGALLILVICFICLICYKRKQVEKEKPEEIYISSGSSVCSHQSSVFRSPIYEELPQFALVKSKTLPSRPPKLPHRCPSCNGERSSRHLHVVRSMSRPRSLPPDNAKHNTMYIKYSRGVANLYDVPPIETHFDPNYELPKSDPPPPPPPGSKRPTVSHRSHQGLSVGASSTHGNSRSLSTGHKPVGGPPGGGGFPPGANGGPQGIGGGPSGIDGGPPGVGGGSQGNRQPTPSPRTQVVQSNPSRPNTQSGLPSPRTKNCIDGIINLAYLPSPTSTEDSSEFRNGHLTPAINIQVSEL